jgi:hypothetical protein
MNRGWQDYVLVNDRKIFINVVGEGDAIIFFMVVLVVIINSFFLMYYHYLRIINLYFMIKLVVVNRNIY